MGSLYCQLVDCDCYFSGVCHGMLYTSAAIVIMTILVSCVRRYSEVIKNFLNPEITNLYEEIH